MKTSLVKVTVLFFLAITFGMSNPASSLAKQSGGKPGGEAAGNNLSFPVIWSDGVAKTLPGSPDVILLNGTMWYWWGTDADGTPLSCRADADDTYYCDDGKAETWGSAPCEDRENPNCMAVFQQQDSLNAWQADSADWSSAPVYVTWIDWGDNLESQDWYIRSKVRTEVVLIKELTTPMLQYELRHLAGWGSDELWGLATDGLTWDNPDTPEDETQYYTAVDKLYENQATIYSGCARLTIQKLAKPRELINKDNLIWNSELGEWEDNEDVPNDVYDYINPSLFNETVWDGGDGPIYYSAEINVKGKVIYGYTWDVYNLNDGEGDYRITFSLDGTNCMILNTGFDENTEILLPVEEIASLEEEDGDEPGGGATGQIDPNKNLTYIDVRILERSGGKK